MKDWLLFYVGRYGKKVGLGLVGLVSVYDLLLRGIRGFFEYSIMYKGITLIWIGLILIGWSKEIEKRWGK